jgi:putative membrane protein
MRYLLTLVLIAIFSYALAVVLQNGTQSPVDLLFTHVPEMRLGLLLLITLALGIVIGLLLGILVFKVIQKTWEIKRLRKDIQYLRQQQIHAAEEAAIQAAAAVKHEKTVLDIHQDDQSSL